MLKPDPLIVETVNRVCTDLCNAALINAAEDGDWPVALWEAMESTGLSRAWVPESAGGPGASLADGFAVARRVARFAAPIPVAETLCAGWLLAEAGLRAPTGPMSVAPVRMGEALLVNGDGRLRGTVNNVPFAARAGHLVVIAMEEATPLVMLVRAADCVSAPGASLAGDAQGAVTLDGVEPVDRGQMDGPDPLAALIRMGAALRAQQMAGALERILDLSLEYARERVQFGRRPIHRPGRRPPPGVPP